MMASVVTGVDKNKTKQQIETDALPMTGAERPASAGEQGLVAECIMESSHMYSPNFSIAIILQHHGTLLNSKK